MIGWRFVSVVSTAALLVACGSDGETGTTVPVDTTIRASTTTTATTTVPSPDGDWSGALAGALSGFFEPAGVFLHETDAQCLADLMIAEIGVETVSEFGSPTELEEELTAEKFREWWSDTFGMESEGLMECIGPAHALELQSAALRAELGSWGGPVPTESFVTAELESCLRDLWEVDSVFREYFLSGASENERNYVDLLLEGCMTDEQAARWFGDDLPSLRPGYLSELVDASEWWPGGVVIHPDFEQGGLWATDPAADGSWRVAPSGSFPSAAPDGRRIAFQGTVVDGWSAILVVDLETGETSQLTDPAADGAFSDTEPAWSRDGEWVAFSRRSETGSGLYKVRPDGSDMQFVAAGLEFNSMSWSPDDTLIVANLDNSSLVLVDVATGEVSEILDVLTWPAFSPIEPVIAFVDEDPDGGPDAVWLWDVPSGDSRQLEIPGLEEPLEVTWSPDGEWLLVEDFTLGMVVHNIESGETHLLPAGIDDEYTDDNVSWAPASIDG